MKIKKILILLLMVFLTIQSPSFAAKSAYTNTSCYVYAKPSTSAARKKISKNTKLYYIGSTGKFFKVTVSGHKVKVYILKKYVSKYKTTTKKKIQTSSSWKSKVEKMNWSKAKKLVKVNQTATLYSVRTGLEFKFKRTGGLNHMDAEPLTAANTTTLWDIAEGYFSWKTHPMILKVSGKYIACSINTMPHGQDKLKGNDFEGCFCIHFINSKTHGTNVINQDHQNQIDAAYKWAQK